jgi:hypothetical protein
VSAKHPVCLDKNTDLGTTHKENAVSRLIEDIRSLDADELVDFAHRLELVSSPLRETGRVVVKQELVAKLFEWNAIKGQQTLELANMVVTMDKAKVKPRNTDRDLNIVLMKDEEGLTFGQIAKKLIMTVKAVQAAYHRMKGRLRTYKNMKG